MERTLIILKPDALMRGIAGEIISRFERVGLKIVGAKMLQPDVDHYYQHYEGISKLKTRTSDEIFETVMEMMQQGPVIALVLEGIDAVDLVRKMVGSTEPKAAQPGTIRGDYSHMSYTHANEQGIGLPNIIHASGEKSEANKEIKHWFSENELYDYEPVHTSFTQPKKKKSKK